LFGILIHELLFIAPTQNRTHDPVFLYNPADGDALREFASLGDARKYLRQQLLQDDYRKRFVALALQSQQAALNQQLERALYSNADQERSGNLASRYIWSPSTAPCQMSLGHSWNPAILYVCGPMLARWRFPQKMLTPGYACRTSNTGWTWA
jgi:hypothetical protein